MTQEEINRIEEDVSKYGLLQFRKYDEFFKQNLVDNKITFGSPRKFNDPFDCNLPIHAECSRFDLQNLLLEIAANQNKYDLALIRRRIEELFFNPTEIEDYIKSQVYDHRRFSCFTIGSNDKHLSNTKFWANYADKHQGICLKFSGNLLKYYYENHKSVIGLVPVEYCSSDEIPHFNYVKNRISREKFASQYFFGTKSKEWKDEEEIRLIYFSKESIRQEDDFVYFEFVPECLTEVYLGYNFDREYVNELKKIFSDPKYHHVKTYLLEINNEKFRFNPTPI